MLKFVQYKISIFVSLTSVITSVIRELVSMTLK